MPKAKSTTKTAVVTGGASGIGAAAAALLLERGWRVALLDRDEKGLAAAHKTYAARKDVMIATLDVTDEPAVEAALGRIERELGPIHGVVNSAGIAADRHIFDTPVDLFRKILDVNVVGTFIVGRASARLMAKRKSGAIVNLASVSGLRGNKGRVAYGASKGGVVTLTQVMANDLAPSGIRVNAVAPGPVDTAMVRAMITESERALWTGYVPLKRYAEPREIASVIAFLLDADAASYVTGAIVPVDGGFSGAGVIVRDGRS